MVDHNLECMQEELESSTKSKDDATQKGLLKGMDKKGARDAGIVNNSGIETGVQSRHGSPGRNSKINLKKRKTIDVNEMPEITNKPEEMPYTMNTNSGNKTTPMWDLGSVKSNIKSKTQSESKASTDSQGKLISSSMEPQSQDQPGSSSQDQEIKIHPDLFPVFELLVKGMLRLAAPHYPKLQKAVLQLVPRHPARGPPTEPTESEPGIRSTEVRES